MAAKQSLRLSSTKRCLHEKITLTVVNLTFSGLLLGGCANTEKRERVAGKPKVDRSRLIATQGAKAAASGEKKDQIICRKHKQIGSNRLYTKCQTVTEVKQAAKDVRSNITGSPLTNTTSDSAREPSR